MKIVHIMKDGSVRDSVKGVMVTNEEFYRVFVRLMEKQEKERERK